MFRSFYSIALCLVLVVPEPATFALLLLVAVCLIGSAVWNIPGFLASSLAPCIEVTAEPLMEGRARTPITPADVAA